MHCGPARFIVRRFADKNVHRTGHVNGYFYSVRLTQTDGMDCDVRAPTAKLHRTIAQDGSIWKRHKSLLALIR